MALQLAHSAPLQLANPLAAPLARIRAFVAAHEGVAHAAMISAGLAAFLITAKLAGA